MTRLQTTETKEMRDTIKEFVFEGFNLTVVEMDGKPYWIAKEVGRALGYSNDGRGLIDFFVRDWSKEFDEGEDYVKLEGKQLSNFKQILKDHEDFSLSSELKFTSRIILFTKEGIFGVLQLTKKEEGHRMRKWLRREVLPSIQETGGYSIHEKGEEGLYLPKMSSKALKILQEQVQAKEEAEAKLEVAEGKIERLHPYAAYGKSVANEGSGARHISTFCKACWIGDWHPTQKFVFEWLEKYGWLFRTGSRAHKEPTAYAVERGYMRCKTNEYEDSDGRPRESVTPLITRKGEQRFLAKLRKEPEFRDVIIFMDDEEEPIQRRLDFGYDNMSNNRLLN